jgi:hypothetical protein
MQTQMLRLAVVLLACVAPRAAQAQEPAAQQGGAIGVFLDCHAPYCDFDHFRREIPFVNWMRDRQDADVHVLVTFQMTGGGGFAYTLAFIGLREFASEGDTLEYVSSADDTESEVRESLTRTIALGLIPYVTESPAAEHIQIAYVAPERALITSDTIYDPWNYWVCRLSVGGSAEGESQQRFLAGNARISANRTTEALKLTARAFWRGSREEFDFTDEETGEDSTVVGVRNFWNLDLLSVWTLSDHWSFGAQGEVEHISTRNTHLGIAAGPAIEYNIYPWQESTRRQLTFLYVIGVAGFDWIEETLFGELREIHAFHQLEVGTEITQPWGSVNASFEAFQYIGDLEDFKNHRLEFDGGFNIRIFRGLEFGIFGSVARIKDQIYLPAEEATPEEILLRQQQRGTDFFFSLHLNLSYRFGSKFNNVVNPRMRGGF